jgi:single-strand DNA-binding protein
MGRLGKEPELRTTQGGNSVASFSVATSERWEKDGKKEEKTEWHRCVAWGKLAENIAKYFKKGSPIFLQGKLNTRSWDGQDGQKHYATEVIVNSFVFVPKDSNNQGGSRDSYGPSDDDAPRGNSQISQGGGNFGSDDDTPF